MHRRATSTLSGVSPIGKRHYRVTLADALSAHDEALAFGGRGGVSSLHLNATALARPYSGYHPALASKAAALLHSMVGNHGFVDGNKRTAWLLVTLLVDRGSHALAIPDDERIDDLVVSVAAGETEFVRLERWFAERIVR